jgi:hypothetical protein
VQHCALHTLFTLLTAHIRAVVLYAHVDVDVDVAVWLNHLCRALGPQNFEALEALAKKVTHKHI